MYIMRAVLCLFSALSRRVGALQISIIFITLLFHTSSLANSKHWFMTSFLQPLLYLVTP